MSIKWHVIQKTCDTIYGQTGRRDLSFYGGFLENNQTVAGKLKFNFY